MDLVIGLLFPHLRMEYLGDNPATAKFFTVLFAAKKIIIVRKLVSAHLPHLLSEQS